MKFGIHIGHMGGPLGEMRKLWKFADAKGFDWFSVSDHFQESPPRGGEMDCYEAIATLTALSVLFFDSLVGYTLAKFRFRGRTIVFMAILSTLMIPTGVTSSAWLRAAAKAFSSWTRTSRRCEISSVSSCSRAAYASPSNAPTIARRAASTKADMSRWSARPRPAGRRIARGRCGCSKSWT